MKKFLFVLPALLLLSACASQKGGVKLDGLLNIANSTSAFTDAKGKQRFEDGLQRINSLSPAQVFQTLHEKLPYAETRNYLPSVNTNRKRYYSLDKTVMADDTTTSSAP